MPTVEHQKADLLKPEFRGIPEPKGSEQRDGQIGFSRWATITHLFSVPSQADLSPLLPHLIWNQRFLQGRSQWQPNRPMYGLLLRAYHLSSPVWLPSHPGYGGCRSWVSLGQAVEVDTYNPALTEAEYQAQVEQILALVPGSASGLEGD
ncbi:MAG: DUF1802 family protein [Leptolyngbyaceae cyanobacterium SM2_3_12]|nr:DUF1802 family protein [Leptolyngbyaceae cyanobacterium SM2_3_12]